MTMIIALLTVREGGIMYKKIKILLSILSILLAVLAVSLLIRHFLLNTKTSELSTEYTDTQTESTEVPVSQSYPDREIYSDVRNQSFEGISKEDITYINDFVTGIYLPLEEQLNNGALTNAIQDPDNKIWNIFDETGEIVIGYAYDTEIWENRENNNCTDEEFQEKYGEPVYYDNKYDSHGMITELKKVQDKIVDSSFKSDFENLIQLVQKMSETHDAEYVYDTFEILHDMYYYLFNYGPELALTSGDRSQSLTYYGSLDIYKDKFVLKEGFYEKYDRILRAGL